jgi:hypothetical protein
LVEDSDASKLLIYPHFFMVLNCEFEIRSAHVSEANIPP